MADNLESLNNSSLREQCIKFGLPNVPVTDSSRRVLIRKLRSSMGNSTLTNSPKQSDLANSKNHQKPCRREKSEGPLICPTKTLGDIDYGKSLDSQKFLKNNKTNSKRKEYLSLVEDHEDLTTSEKYPITTSNNLSDAYPAFDYYSGNNVHSKNTSDIKRTNLRRFTSTNEYNILSKVDSIAPKSIKTSTQGYEDGLKNTPYLSNFARTLERLKMDQLGTITPSFPIHTKEEIHFRSTNFESKDRCSTVAHTFNQFFFALERKYRLKRNLTVAVAFLIIVFIFVFFIM